MSTRKYRQAAHDALHPLWSVCNETLKEKGQDKTRPGSKLNVTTFETVGGAVITRVGDTVEVCGEFETFTKNGKEAEEIVTITFPEDIRDLADTRIERELLVEGGGGGISGGNVGIRDYRSYAEMMMGIVRPTWVNEPA